MLLPSSFSLLYFLSSLDCFSAFGNLFPFLYFLCFPGFPVLLPTFLLLSSFMDFPSFLYDFYFSEFLAFGLPSIFLDGYRNQIYLDWDNLESKILHLDWDNQTKRVNDQFSLIIGAVPLEGPILSIHLCIYEGGTVALSSPDSGF